MKIDKTTPEKIMKDLESARYKESEKRKSLGTTVSFTIGVLLAIWWMTEPTTLKEFGASAYDFIKIIPQIVQEKFNELV